MPDENIPEDSSIVGTTRYKRWLLWGGVGLIAGTIFSVVLYQSLTSGLDDTIAVAEPTEEPDLYDDDGFQDDSEDDLVDPADVEDASPDYGDVVETINMTYTSDEGYTADVEAKIYETLTSEDMADMSCTPEDGINESGYSFDLSAPHVFKSAFIEVTAVNTTANGMSWPNAGQIPLRTGMGRGSGDLSEFVHCTISGDEDFLTVSDGEPVVSQLAVGIAAPITPNSPEGSYDSDPSDMWNPVLTMGTWPNDNFPYGDGTCESKGGYYSLDGCLFNIDFGFGLYSS